MSDDISELLWLVKKLHLACKSYSVIERLRLVQEIEFNLSDPLHFLENVLLHTPVSHNLRVFEDSFDYSLIFS